MDGYSCEWITSLRKLNLLFCEQSPGILNVCFGEHLILLFSLWTVTSAMLERHGEDRNEVFT